MMSLPFGLFTQVSGSGPLGPLVIPIAQYSIWISGSDNAKDMVFFSSPEPKAPGELIVW